MENLEHLGLIWASVLLSSWLAKKTSLTPVLYFLAFGALLVNLGLLPKETTEFISGFSELGIILIMFALGFEENLGNFMLGIKRSWGIALFGAIAPFATAWYLAMQFWGDEKVAILCGLAMTATAVSLTMISLKAEGLSKSRAATGIMTSAVLDDIASLVLVAILVPMVTSGETASLAEIGIILIKTTAFFLLVTLAGMVLLPSRIGSGLFSRIPVIRDHGIRELLLLTSGGKATLTILLLAVMISIIAAAFGFHPAIGAYMAGLILKEEYFDFPDRRHPECYANTRQIIDDVAFSWIGPVFFVELGTKLVFETELFFSVLPEVLILTSALLVAQIVSAALAARYTGSFAWHEAWMIGFGMLGRAELAFVVMDIGYVEYHILTTEAFYTLMGTTFLLNVSVPLLIRFWRPRYVAAETKRGR